MAATNGQQTSKNVSIVIVGSGVFGLSTALELCKRGYSNIKILDRFLPPVPDGSSVDISRVMRVDYADPLYAKMAAEALVGWKTTFKPWFHQSGFLMVADQIDHPYVTKSRDLLIHQQSPVHVVHNKEDLHRRYPMLSGHADTISGYENPSGGWVDAAGSIQHLARLCSLHGVNFVTGKRGTVLSLDIVDNSVRGLRVASDEIVTCDKVILCCGAWTSRLIELGGSAVATGQPVGFIQLTAAEAETIRKMPVVINLTSGVFCFPPTPDTNVLKLARHGYGYETSFSVSSSGRTVSSPLLSRKDMNPSYIPRDAEESLRRGLARILPQFADYPWLKTRLCWYFDTERGDFIIDYHPSIGNLFIATGGSGHAFKFLPVIGKYIADHFENKYSVEVGDKWRCKLVGQVLKGDGSRGGPLRRRLSREEQSRL